MSMPPRGPYPPQTAPAQLVVVLRKPFGLLSEHMVRPTVMIDNFPAPAQWGPNFYPIQPGRHQVHCRSSYLWEFGAQTMIVDVPPQQTVAIHYTGPVFVFLAGRMGFVEQPRAGFGAFLALMIIPAVIILLIVVGVLVAALAG